MSSEVSINDVIAVGGDSINHFLWSAVENGNQPVNGAIGTSTGFYVSVDGETAIGLTCVKEDEDLDLVYGADTACVFMGAISMGKNNAWKGTIVGVE
jgi:hypothetical protein